MSSLDPNSWGQLSTPPRRAANDRRIDATLARLAAPQHGILSWLQLLAAGLTPKAIEYQWVIGYEVDAIWRAQGLIVELDSRTFHDHDDPFERDREKDADLIAAGYRVVRLTWQRLVHHPDREANRFAALRHDSP